MAKRPVMCPSHFMFFDAFCDLGTASSLIGVLGISYDSLLQVQIVKQFEIRIHIIIFFHVL